MTSKWRANNHGASPDAARIAEQRTYPKPSGSKCAGVPRGGVNRTGYQYRDEGAVFDAEGIDSEEKTMGFPDDQLLGFSPGSGKKRNTPF